jgi:hypothetical protein
MAKRLAPIIGHAAKRLTEWGITKADAEFVLNNYDSDQPANIPGARKLHATMGVRRVGIVVLPLGEDLYELCTVWARGETKR